MLNVPFPQQSWSDVTVTSETVLWETHILKLYLGNYSLGEKHLIELMVVIEFHFFFFFSWGFLYLQKQPYSVKLPRVLHIWANTHCFQYTGKNGEFTIKYSIITFWLAHVCEFCQRCHEMARSGSFIWQILLACLCLSRIMLRPWEILGWIKPIPAYRKPLRGRQIRAPWVTIWSWRWVQSQGEGRLAGKDSQCLWHPCFQTAAPFLVPPTWVELLGLSTVNFCWMIAVGDL